MVLLALLRERAGMARQARDLVAGIERHGAQRAFERAMVLAAEDLERAIRVPVALGFRPADLRIAAIAIGFAVLFDGLDGRIARLTRTTSAFGRELDSLADVITFGVAPALLAWHWGFHLISRDLSSDEIVARLSQFGAIASFLFLIAGASRLARFNIAKDPQPSNPGRPGKSAGGGTRGCTCSRTRGRLTTR